MVPRTSGCGFPAAGGPGGAEDRISADLEPGSYELVCFLRRPSAQIGVGAAELARELVEVARLRPSHVAQRAADRDALVRRLLRALRCDAVLGQPAREVLARHLARRPPQRRALGVAAAGQPARASAADEQPAVQHGLAGVRRVIDAREPRDRGDRAARLVRREAAELDRRDDPVARRPTCARSPRPERCRRRG